MNTIIIQCYLPLSNYGRHAYGFATCSYDLYTKHNDEDYNRFCWNIIIIQCKLPLSNYGRPLHPKLPPTRMTHTPSSMIKMTTDFVETASLSSVTYLCQITVVHCTPNCHLLVWPIYYVCFIVTHYSRSIVTHSSRSIVTNHKCSIVTQFTFKYKPPPLKLWGQ